MSQQAPSSETYRRKSMDSGSRGGAAELRRRSHDEPATLPGHLPSAARQQHGGSHQQTSAHRHHGGGMMAKPREQLREAPSAAAGMNSRHGSRTAMAHSNVARHRMSLDEARTSAVDHRWAAHPERSAADHNNNRRMSLDEYRRPSKSSTGKALRPSTALYSDERAPPPARPGRANSETLIAADHHSYRSRRNLVPSDASLLARTPGSSAGVTGSAAAAQSRRGSRTDTGQVASSRGGKHASCMKFSGSVDSFIRAKGGATSTSHRSFLHLSDRDAISPRHSDHTTMDASELMEESLEVVPSHKSCPHPELLAMTRNASTSSDRGYALPDTSYSYGNSGSEEGSRRGRRFSDEQSELFDEGAAVPAEGDAITGQAGQPPSWKRTVLKSAVCSAAIRMQAKKKETATKNRENEAKPALKGKAAVQKEIDDFLIKMKSENAGDSSDDEEEEESHGNAGASSHRKPAASLARKNLFSRTEDRHHTPNKSSLIGSSTGSSRRLRTNCEFMNMLKPVSCGGGRKWERSGGSPEQCCCCPLC